MSKGGSRGGGTEILSICILTNWDLPIKNNMMTYKNLILDQLLKYHTGFTDFDSKKFSKQQPNSK